jgi:hypothetical protein
MIIEIRKKKSIEHVDWYYVMKDNVCIDATTDEQRAHQVYDTIKKDAEQFVEIVIKREEINV